MWIAAVLCLVAVVVTQLVAVRTRGGRRRGLRGLAVLFGLAAGVAVAVGLWQQANQD
ncbi:hypothetical protein ACFY3U_18430 [Micromonospora sp. NPDC000089]|uniref:hypothetical protein n=1 Tax=unclassified Micromonospora TaxID=2617518 RepID=UPI00367A22B7